MGLEVFIQLFIDDSFKSFRDCSENRNWPIVGGFQFTVLL